MTDTYTLDLEDYVDELQGDLESLEERADEIVEKASEYDDEEDYVPTEIREEYEEIDQQYQRVEGTIERVEDTIEEYGGSEWEARELTGGTIIKCRDEISRQSRTGEVPEGALQISLCKEALVDSPPEAPTRAGDPDPGEYPPNILQYLFREIESINTGGSSKGLGPLEDQL